MASEMMAMEQTAPQTSTQSQVPDRGPQLDPALVKAFVIAGHGNIEKVKQLLEQEPHLINAAWDWGGGDWETALGGAAHMGRREIASLLLEKGARIDLFAATMLGQLGIVKAAVTAFPAIVHVKGPHGIPLVAHASAGGKEAEDVLAFLHAQKLS